MYTLLNFTFNESVKGRNYWKSHELCHNNPLTLVCKDVAGEPHKVVAGNLSFIGYKVILKLLALGFLSFFHEAKIIIVTFKNLLKHRWPILCIDKVSWKGRVSMLSPPLPGQDYNTGSGRVYWPAETGYRLAQAHYAPPLTEELQLQEENRRRKNERWGGEKGIT